jgi:hypothetical protein
LANILKTFAIGLAAAAVLAGCGRIAPWRPAPARPDQPADNGYRDPPQPLAVSRDAAGLLSLSGRSSAQAQVQLSPESGAPLRAMADQTGLWRIDLPANPQPALYGLSEERDGRRVQAQGYVALLPGPRPLAAQLRAGAGALVQASGGPNPQILAVDLDRGGTAAFSGRAGPGKPVRLIIDGVAAVESMTGADGRFSAVMPKALTPQAHRLVAQTPSGSTQIAFEATPAAPLVGLYRAVPRGGGWRIDWMTPAGGVQTTLLFAELEASR